MSLPYALDFTKASAEDAEKTFGVMLKYVTYYNYCVQSYPMLKLPDYITRYIKTAKGTSGKVSNVAGYAADLMEIKSLLSELDALSRRQQPWPPDRAALIFSKILIYTAKYVSKLPTCGYMAGPITSIAEALPGLVHKCIYHGLDQYEGGAAFVDKVRNGGDLTR